MALIQRKKAHNEEKVQKMLNESKIVSRSGKGYNVIRTIVLALILFPVLYFAMIESPDAFAARIELTSNEDGTSHILDPHRVAVVSFQDVKCFNPQIWLRITGDALVNIPLSKIKKKMKIT
jgi:hypothetical protein